MADLDSGASVPGLEEGQSWRRSSEEKVTKLHVALARRSFEAS